MRSLKDDLFNVGLKDVDRDWLRRSTLILMIPTVWIIEVPALMFKAICTPFYIISDCWNKSK